MPVRWRWARPRRRSVRRFLFRLLLGRGALVLVAVEARLTAARVPLGPALAAAADAVRDAETVYAHEPAPMRRDRAIEALRLEVRHRDGGALDDAAAVALIGLARLWWLAGASS